MKKIAIPSALLMLAVSLAASAGDEAGRTYRGEISDSQCAFNVHSLTQSHEEMLKSKSGAAGSTPTSCARYCVEHLGGKFVLVARGHVYHLDNQDLMRSFVGEKVKLRGVLDTNSEAIHVLDVSAE
jgi:hypothetical protein